MRAHHALRLGGIDVFSAWSSHEVADAVRAGLSEHADRLPADRDAAVVIKPNLNNDLVALTGGCTDLRVLCALVEALRDLGYRDLTVADGPNVGIERRGIDVLRRLRVAGLASRYGVRVVDLNHQPAVPVRLRSGASVQVARLVHDAALLIDVPTVKTHAEMGLSAACKNWVGLVRGQDKRRVHDELAGNIVGLVSRLPPDLCVVDGLVAMEGNGPGDGEPVRLGRVVFGHSPWLVDLVLCRLVGLPWTTVPILVEARDRGHLSEADAAEVAARVEVVRPIAPAPPRSALARLSEARLLRPLKLAARPVVDRPGVAALARRARVIQDVYDRRDDTITRVTRDPGRCRSCGRCEEVCPERLSREAIGTEACIGCLYCWWRCPTGAIGHDGRLGAMERQASRYKRTIEQL